MTFIMCSVYGTYSQLTSSQALSLTDQELLQADKEEAACTSSLIAIAEQPLQIAAEVQCCHVELITWRSPAKLKGCLNGPIANMETKIKKLEYRGLIKHKHVLA